MYFASPRSVGGGCRNHVDVAMVASRLAEGHEALEGDRLFALHVIKRLSVRALRLGEPSSK